MADQVITKQELIDAQKDAQTLEEVINGEPGKLIKTRLNRMVYTLASVPQINTMTREEVTAAVAPKANKADVDVALSNLSTTANKYYSTLAAANADIANIALNQSVTIGEEANSGLWEKKTANATTLTKSPYDPIEQANDYVDEKIIHDPLGTDIFQLKDASGKSVIVLKKDGKLYVVGLQQDVATAINSFNNLMSTDNSDYIFKVLDSSGAKTMYQNLKGDLILPNVGNLTLALGLLKDSISNTDEINLKSAHLSAKYTDYLLAETIPDFENTDYLLKASEVNAMAIFPHEVSLLRIPAITRIGKSKYLLFFEARQSYDDFGMNSQGVAIITVEETTGVATVSNIQCLHAAFTDADNKLRTFMNACAVKLDSGRIICLYVRRHGLTEHELYQRYSDNDGETWSEYVDITGVKGSTGWNVLCPCSQGLVKRYGQHKGRVVFPLWTTGKTYQGHEFRSGYIYSDDNGVTWNLGEFAYYESANEVQCAEDLNGDMLFSIRLEHRNPSKVIARHSDKTKEYSTVKLNKRLTDEAIMSGLIQGENKYDASVNKFQLSTCKTTSRTELLIHTSYDGGENWVTHLLPSTAGLPVGYSCIESLTMSKKFLVWEADVVANLKYSVISLSNLLNEAQ